VTIDTSTVLAPGFILLLKFVISFHCGATATSYSPRYTTGTVPPWSALSSPALWFRNPTEDVPLSLSSRILPVPEPQQILTHTERDCNSSPVVISNNTLLL
jgi:hypothetical protein